VFQHRERRGQIVQAARVITDGREVYVESRATSCGCKRRVNGPGGARRRNPSPGRGRRSVTTCMSTERNRLPRCRTAPREPVQWAPLRVPARRVCIFWLPSLRSMISTFLPRAAYLVVTASSAATEDASQMWARDMSMTIWSGSFA
jgi:hypothetical protein